MQIDLLQGTLDMLILKALKWGPMHGYAIVRWLQSATDDVLLVEEGSLYPALHRLARRGWVSAEWGVSENNRRAKYYALTSEGRHQLHREVERWQHFTHAVAKVIELEPERAG
jgi:transcriptional regulator